MVTSAQCQSVLVRHADHIVRVSRFKHKAHQTSAPVTGAKDAHPWDLLEQGNCLFGKRLVMVEDTLASDAVQYVLTLPRRWLEQSQACRLQSDAAGFKFALGECYARSSRRHLKGLHVLEDFFASIKHPHAGGPASYARKRPGSRSRVGGRRTAGGPRCAASTSVVTPACLAQAQISATGLIVPRVFEICVKARILTGPSSECPDFPARASRQS